MANNRTGEDFIDWYEKQKNHTINEKKRYYLERQKQKNKALLEAGN